VKTVFAALVLIVSFANEAVAQTSGVISGKITINSSRRRPWLDLDNNETNDQPAGARFPNRFWVAAVGNVPAHDTPVNFSGAKIQTRVCNPATNCSAWKTTYTSTAGNYSTTWSHSPVNSYPAATSVQMRVWATRRAVDPSDPTVTYSVAVSPSAATQLMIYSATFNTPMPSTGNVIVSPLIGAGLPQNIYISADEVITMVATDNTINSVDQAHFFFRDLDIIFDSNSANVFTYGGVAPTNETILFTPGVGHGATSVAHEMGHIAHWRAHGFSVAPINPLPGGDYDCDGASGWDMTTNECQRAAFADGFAEFFASLWMWKPKTLNTGNNEYRWKDGVRWLLPDTVAANINCTNTGSTNAGQALCNMRALWRVYRAGNSNELRTILDTMRNYVQDCDTCGDNHCADEDCDDSNGPSCWFPALCNDRNANNWKDFEYNYDAGPGLVNVLNITPTMGMSSATNFGPGPVPN
jgi:hypothetical protein